MTSLGHPSKTSQSTGSSEFLFHEPCEECGSSDAKSVYDDGHSYCFVCHHYTHGDGEPSLHIHQTKSVQILGSAQRLQNRNISQKVCEKYKIYRDGDKLRFYYHDESGIVKGAKVKTKNKQFSYEGESTGTFFGQHLFPSTGKRVVITEGELDAVSCYEAMSGWPMVSLPSGAAAARKAIQRNLEWLQGYEEIVLFFDNDDAGRKATEEACQVLPPGKVKIANLLGDYKDASDAISANDSHAVCKAIWDAKPYRPDGIVEGKSLLEVVTTPSPAADHDYPFQGLQSKLHGIRYRELVCITSGSGQGKSSFCRELAADFLSKGERVGYLALEESNRRTALGLMSAHVGKSLHLGEHTHEELTEAFDATMANWNLYLFDGFGSYDPDVIYNRIEYLASGLDCRIIFLDHLSILLSGLDGDERRMIDTTMTKLRSLVERTGIVLFLVSHLKRTSSDQNHEEGARVTLGQLRGSAAIAQLSDAVIGLERNQQSNQVRSATTVRVLKNRYSGETGVACMLDYDLNTCKFNETQAEPEFNASTDF
jgi:twinkle protein